MTRPPQPPNDPDKEAAARQAVKKFGDSLTDFRDKLVEQQRQRPQDPDKEEAAREAREAVKNLGDSFKEVGKKLAERQRQRKKEETAGRRCDGTYRLLCNAAVLRRYQPRLVRCARSCRHRPCMDAEVAAPRR